MLVEYQECAFPAALRHVLHQHNKGDQQRNEVIVIEGKSGVSQGEENGVPRVQPTPAYSRRETLFLRTLLLVLAQGFETRNSFQLS